MSVLAQLRDAWERETFGACDVGREMRQARCARCERSSYAEKSFEAHRLTQIFYDNKLSETKLVKQIALSPLLYLLSHFSSLFAILSPLSQTSECEERSGDTMFSLLFLSVLSSPFPID